MQAAPAPRDNAAKLEDYKLRLSHKDLAVFERISVKFGKYIANPRAFYSEARAKILELIEAAYENAAFHSGVQKGAPLCFIQTQWARCYVYLVHGLYMNQEKYNGDPGLHDKLRYLIATAFNEQYPPGPHVSPPDPVCQQPGIAPSTSSRPGSAAPAASVASAEPLPTSPTTATHSAPSKSRKLVFDEIAALDEEDYEATRQTSSSASPEIARGPSEEQPRASQTPVPVAKEEQDIVSMEVDTPEPESQTTQRQEEPEDMEVETPPAARLQPMNREDYQKDLIDLGLSESAVIVGGVDIPCPKSTGSIHVKPDLFKALAKWNGRCDDPSGLDECQCISLCATTYDEIDALGMLSAEADPQLAALLPSKLRAFWGAMETCRLTFAHQNDIVLDLSDPTIRPFGLIDLSPYLQEGVNELQLEAERTPALGALFFVVRHSPTARQLAHVLVERTKRLESNKSPVPVDPFPIRDIVLPEHDGFSDKTSAITCDILKLPPATMKLHVELSSEQFAKISRWNARFKDHTDEVETSLVVSFVCSQMDNAREYMSEQKFQAEKLTISWPQRGNVDMNIPGRDVVIPLSPPVLPDVNGAVDLSPYLVEGKNELNIACNDDFGVERRVVAVLVHPPTKKQLQQVLERRKAERQFGMWTEETFKKPLEWEEFVPAGAS